MKISFAHNVQNRFKTLRETIEMERKFFPESQIYVAYNDNSFNLRYFDDLENIKYIKYIGEGHKIGCVNGCITAIKETLNDESDVIVFSHDDVKINPLYVNIFVDNIEQVLNGENNSFFDVVCRQPNTFGNNYYMMEGFFLNKKAAKKIFEVQPLYLNENELPRDINNSPSPEVWLYNTISITNLKIKHITYQHSTNNYNEILAKNMGLYHKNAGIRGWKD